MSSRARFSATIDSEPSRTTLSAVIAARPTAAPCSRDPHAAGYAKMAPMHRAMGSPPLQLASA